MVENKMPSIAGWPVAARRRRILKTKQGAVRYACWLQVTGDNEKMITYLYAEPV